METLEEFLARHRRSAPHDAQRLGQRFVNEFIRGPMPSLFYEADDDRALAQIRDYLQRLQLLPHVPPKLLERKPPRVNPQDL